MPIPFAGVTLTGPELVQLCRKRDVPVGGVSAHCSSFQSIVREPRIMLFITAFRSAGLDPMDGIMAYCTFGRYKSGKI